MRIPLAFCAIAMMASSWGAARLEMPGVFGDGMVLQRDRPVPVWGKADPGATVTVEFANQKLATQADKNGSWRVTLAPMPANATPQTLKITTANSSTTPPLHLSTFKDLLVGEVWLSTGQSNMECPIWGPKVRYRDGMGAMKIAMTRKPEVRFFKAKRRLSLKPQRIIGQWRPFLPASFAPDPEDDDLTLAAIGFYYALEVNQALGVPVGIIDTCWCGTNIDAWTPVEEIAKHPELADIAAWKPVAKWTKDVKGTHTICGDRQQPGVLWNAMISDLVPFACRGAIWFQGCHNSDEPWSYRIKMHALYDAWSKAWGRDDFRFYFCELYPLVQTFVAMREEQHAFADEEKNANIAVLTDWGNIRDAHPEWKEIVSRRLALFALKRDYGFDLTADSPELENWKVEDGNFRLTFRNAKRLYVHGYNPGDRPPFEVAGADGRFFPAVIRNMKGFGYELKGNELVVGSDAVKNPKSLRYAQSTPWRGCVYSEAALPLGAFQVGWAQALMTGKIADPSRHELLNPRFAKAFAFLKRKDLATLKTGRYEIDGDRCYAMIQECALKPFGEKTQTTEVHKRYIDIQSPLDGPETIGFLDLAGGKVFEPFDDAKDYALADVSTEPVTLWPGEYCILMPRRGAHAPGLTTGQPAKRRKVVIKVLADWWK